MQRYLCLCLLSALTGCQVPAAHVSPAGPDSPISSPPIVLARQLLTDSAVEMTCHPLRSSLDLLAELLGNLEAAGHGIFGKRLCMRLYGSPGPMPACRGTLDPAALEAELQTQIESSLQPAGIQLYPEGARALAALKDVIDQAACRIDVLMFQWEDDPVGVAVASWLAARAGPHLQVRVLMDGGGNLLFGGCSQTGSVNQVVCALARQPYVEVLRTRNPFGRFDHRKLVIVDGRLAWTGGRNFTCDSFFAHHDLSFTLSGPLVNELENVFERFWQDQGGKPVSTHALAGSRQWAADSDQSNSDGTPQGRGSAATAPPAGPHSLPTASCVLSAEPPTARCPLPTGANALARLVWNGPGKRQLGQVLYQAVDMAQHHVYLENFCFCDSGLVYKLARARRRGVDVRVVMTIACGTGPVDRANRLTANRLLRAGVRIYVYPGMTHTKAAAVDGCWVYLGTGNFDPLSLRHNREVGLAVGAGPILQEVEQRLFRPDFCPAWELKKPLPLCLGDYAWELMGSFFL